jgi:hypothetical protein
VAEPYVPIADLTTYSALLTDLEVATDSAETNANAINTAQSQALSSRNTAQSALEQKFNQFLLVGA